MLGWILAAGAVWWLFLRKSVIVAADGFLSGISLGNASMGIHQAPKGPSDTVSVTVTWSGSTQSATGSLISWPYRVSAAFIAPDGKFVGWVLSPPVVAPPLVAQTTVLTLFLANQFLAGTVVGVQARLMGGTSDSSGTPILDAFLDIPGVVMDHPAAIKIASTAVPQGAIGSVDVAQLAQSMRL